MRELVLVFQKLNNLNENASFEGKEVQIFAFYFRILE